MKKTIFNKTFVLNSYFSFRNVYYDERLYSLIVYN